MIRTREQSVKSCCMCIRFFVKEGSTLETIATVEMSQKPDVEKVVFYEAHL